MVLFSEQGQEDFVVSKFHKMTAVVRVKDEEEGREGVAHQYSLWSVCKKICNPQLMAEMIACDELLSCVTNGCMV